MLWVQTSRMLPLVISIENTNNRAKAVSEFCLERLGLVPNVPLQNACAIVDDVLVIPVLHDVTSHPIDLCIASAASRELSESNYTTRQDGCDEPAIPTAYHWPFCFRYSTKVIKIVSTIGGSFPMHFISLTSRVAVTCRGTIPTISNAINRSTCDARTCTPRGDPCRPPQLRGRFLFHHPC